MKKIAVVLLSGALCGCIGDLPQDVVINLLMNNAVTGDFTPPTLVSVSPADGSLLTTLTPTISFTFSENMDYNKLFVQETDGACSQNIWVSGDDFTSCVGMTLTPRTSVRIDITPKTYLYGRGSYKLRFNQASDLAGNLLEREISYSTPMLLADTHNYAVTNAECQRSCHPLNIRQDA